MLRNTMSLLRFSIIGVLMLLPFFSCKQSKTNSIKLPTIELDILRVNDKFSKVGGESIKILLEETQNSIVGRVDQVRLIEDDIFVLDKKQKTIFRFNRDGCFLSAVHAVGRGPGEYLNIQDFLVKESQVYLLDFMGRILIYDFNGQFKEQIVLPFQATYFEYLGDNSFVFQDIRVNGSLKHIVGVFCTMKNEFIDQLELPENLTDDAYPFMRSKHLWLGSGGVYFNYDYSDVIYKITSSQIKPMLQIKSSNMPSVNEIKEYATNPTKRQEESWGKLFHVSSIFEYDDMISFCCILNKRYVRVFCKLNGDSLNGFKEWMLSEYAHQNDSEIISFDFQGQFKDVDSNPIVLSTELLK